jgi:hypothetical protein
MSVKMLAVVSRRQILTLGRKVQPARESKLLDIADAVGYRYQDTPRADHIHRDVPAKKFKIWCLSCVFWTLSRHREPRGIVSTPYLSKVDGR